MRASRLNLRVAWLVTSLVSVVVGVGIYLGGKAGDCKPRQIDGQCGMSTFFGLIYGIAAGVVIFVGMGIYFLRVAYERRTSSEEK